MLHSYFKVRDPWSFKPHRFEIGTPVIQSSFHDNHFFLKLYKVGENEFADFYNYHLGHYLENFPGDEQDFHRYVSDIVSTRITQLKLINPFQNTGAFPEPGNQSQQSISAIDRAASELKGRKRFLHFQDRNQALFYGLWVSAPYSIAGIVISVLFYILIRHGQQYVEHKGF